MLINPKIPKEDFEQYFAIYDSIRTKAIKLYVSTPVSTGKIYYEWLKSNPDLIKDTKKYKDSHIKNVIIKNIKNAQIVINNMLTGKGEPIIIDPTKIEVKKHDWIQDDFFYFWGTVIKRYVDFLYFNDGWEYSNGCVYEMYIAQYNHKSCLDKNDFIFPRGAIITIEKATEDIKYMGYNADFIRKVLQALKEL